MKAQVRYFSTINLVEDANVSNHLSTCAAGKNAAMSIDRRRAVILHGKPDEDEYLNAVSPSGSNSHWIPWLQKQLQIRGHDAQTPEIVDAWKPQYEIWCREFERHLIDEPMILVGHSCGGGFLLRWLSEHSEVQVHRLALVAPWLDPGRSDTTDFFDFEIDARLAERIGELHVFHSDDDMASIVRSVEMIQHTIPGIRLHRYDNMGHFCLSDMGTVEFPDLLTAVAS